VYLPLAHMTCGGGFLATHGVLDFAGGLVVHVSSGFAALAAVFVVGGCHVQPGERMLPHSVAFVALGAALLWFGWFGFNAGSGLTANDIAAQAFINTDIAGSETRTSSTSSCGSPTSWGISRWSRSPTASSPT